MTDQARKRVLIYATKLDLQKGVTGATLGTSIVRDQLAMRCETESISLDSYGIDSLGAVGRMAPLRRALRAAGATLISWARIGVRGVRGPRVDYVYYLPAASLGGALRDAGLTVLLRTFFRRARIIQHVRNGNYFEARYGLRAALRRFATRRAFRIFVLSERLVPEWSRVDAELRARLFVLPNTIDRALLPSNNEERPLRPASGRTNVLYMSNYIVSKGYFTLLEAVGLLADRGYGHRLHITFHGTFLNSEMRDKFLTQVDRLACSELSLTAGAAITDRDLVRKLYASHDIFCLPTSYPAEAQPRSILEAMANGCAIIATRWRSIPDMVISGKTGVLINQREAAELADAIELCLSSDLEKMRQASQALFAEKFSPESISRRLYEGFDL